MSGYEEEVERQKAYTVEEEEDPCNKYKAGTQRNTESTWINGQLGKNQESFQVLRHGFSLLHNTGSDTGKG